MNTERQSSFQMQSIVESQTPLPTPSLAKALVILFPAKPPNPVKMN